MKLLPGTYLATLLLTSLAMADVPGNGTSPQEVITRLVADASKNPPGPVENDVTEQTVQTATALAKDPKFKDMGISFRESIATEYNEFNLNGPLTSLYSEGPAALFYGKATMTEDAFSDQKENTDSDTLLVNGKAVSTTHDSGAGWGDSGGFSCFVGPPIKSPHVIATFCLVQQHGLWKVHGVYLSNDILDGSNKSFIITHLAAFAKKS